MWALVPGDGLFIQISIPGDTIFNEVPIDVGPVEPVVVTVVPGRRVPGHGKTTFG